jgi:uncharacterized low-complexity protein
MSKPNLIKPVAAVAGIAFASTVALSGVAVADEANPFEMTDLDDGYMVAGGKGEEGKCGEGKCGEEGDKGEEGKCGEGKCGEEEDKGEEGKCGEGKCGA